MTFGGETKMGIWGSPSGRRVVAILLGGVGVLCALSWTAVDYVRTEVDAQAKEHGVPRLSRQEAAIRVAKEDRFGLPSRLENPPKRDIEAFRSIGTYHQPLPNDRAGVTRLLETRKVSLELCRKATRTVFETAQESFEVSMTLTRRGDWSHPSNFSVTHQEAGAYERCVVGGLQDAVFEASSEPTSNFVLHFDLR
jgi:hypothetical protein